jgi:PAS domain S-box-containing protein
LTVFYILLLMSSAAVCAFSASIAWARRRLPGARWVSIFLGAQCIWSLTYALFWAAPEASRLTWLNMTYFGVVVVPVAFFMFTLYQTGRVGLARNPVLSFFLMFMTLMTLVLLWTDQLHGLFFGGTQSANSSVILSGGPWFWIHAAFSYILLLISTVWLWRAWRRSHPVFREQMALLLLAALLPWLANAIGLSGMNPLPGLDLTPVAFTFSGVFLAYSLYRSGLLDLTPVARNQVVETMSDSVVVVDELQRVVDTNPSADALLAALHGGDTTSAIGRSVARVLPAWKEWSAQTQVASFASEVLRPDGTSDVGTFRVAISPLLSSEGVRQGSVLVLSDVSEARQLEVSRQQSLAYFQAIFDSSTDAIFICDAETARIIDANTRASEMFGYTREEIIGSGDINQFSSGDGPYTAENGIQYFVRAREQGPQNFEWQGRTKDNRVIWLDMRIRYAQLGGSTRFLMTVNDVTERRQTQQHDFELALERERVQILEHFIRDASHEFRTPLATIQTSLYLLARSDDPLHRQAKSAQIEQEIQRLTRLLEMLVTLTTLDSGHPLDCQPCALNDVVSGAVLAYGGGHLPSRLTMTLAEPDVIVSVDMELMREALVQLVDNALRYTTSDGHVWLTMEQRGGWVRVRVRDDGPGIPADMLPMIFDRFYRMDVAHSSPGFGLGLAIVKRIAEAHHGTLEVESQVGQGCVFTLSLPEAQTAEAVTNPAAAHRLM